MRRLIYLCVLLAVAGLCLAGTETRKLPSKWPRASVCKGDREELLLIEFEPHPAWAFQHYCAYEIDDDKKIIAVYQLYSIINPRGISVKSDQQLVIGGSVGLSGDFKVVYYGYTKPPDGAMLFDSQSLGYHELCTANFQNGAVTINRK